MESATEHGENVESDYSIVSIESHESSSVIYVGTTYSNEEKDDKKSEDLQSLCANIAAMSLTGPISSTPKKSSGAVQRSQGQNPVAGASAMFTHGASQLALTNNNCVDQAATAQSPFDFRAQANSRDALNRFEPKPLVSVEKLPIENEEKFATEEEGAVGFAQPEVGNNIQDFYANDIKAGVEAIDASMAVMNGDNKVEPKEFKEEM